jgi:hypothetical protein
VKLGNVDLIPVPVIPDGHRPYPSRGAGSIHQGQGTVDAWVNAKVEQIIGRGGTIWGHNFHQT